MGNFHGSFSYGKRKQKQQHLRKRHYNPESLVLLEAALSELKRAASHFTSIEDICRLRQVYYLQARVCHLLPTNVKEKQRDEAANFFALLSVCKRQRTIHSVLNELGSSRIPSTINQQNMTVP